ncbi:High mobility group protein [Rhynchospora pubera]|uniref:High mobility group protein n=1 Tax=Rhynchospora pubera TaxID=906938 RepID=A0AAV8HHE5_9POAL|nr:High mobility group protein [Rhynchospora pubera]
MKKKAAEKAKPAKRSQAAKDPNKPMRPPSAFFDFMEEFRKTFKEKNYNNKSVYVVGKTGGDKWKILSEAKKAPNVAKANKIKSVQQQNECLQQQAAFFLLLKDAVVVRD